MSRSEIVTRGVAGRSRGAARQGEGPHSQREAFSADRRRLPMVKIDAEYLFDGPESRATLSDLFDGRRQLIVQYFMFDHDWDEGCPIGSLSDRCGSATERRPRSSYGRSAGSAVAGESAPALTGASESRAALKARAWLSSQAGARRSGAPAPGQCEA